ncbi:MFS transporter [Micromonospora echinofusca]|uniref:MFS transporter n=1 Tax=Micromonospora echinofusca TaxID=47858 RepID=A0ABS3VZM6_MICEH|nr:MFS transporter [Micromonospora echinofusca]
MGVRLTTDTAAPDAPPRRAGRREWTGLAVLALPTLLLALDLSVLYLALPRLSADLGADSTAQLWITDIYGFMIAGFLVTMGTLGDRIGRRRLLLIGAAAFAAASVLAAYAATPEQLIACRALLGVAGATLMPSTLALISNMFPVPAQRATAIGVWMSCFMGGMAVGPVIGGVLLANFWWGSAFLLGVPVMVLLLVAAPVLLPEYRQPVPGRLDLTSVALSLAAILPVIYGLKELARYGWQPLPAVALAGGTGLAVLFVRRQRTLAHPLLDVGLFANRTFRSALLLSLLNALLMGGTFLLVSQYLQLVEGLSPLRAGLWLVPQAVAMITATMLTPVAARRIRPAYVMAAGQVVTALGFGLLAVLSGEGSLPVAVVAFVLAAAGIALPSQLVTDLIVGAAPREKAGSAASVSETSGEFGVALGVAAVGSLAAVVYRGRLTETLPGGLPADVVDRARDGLAGAAEVAATLPAGSGTELLTAARAAYTAGLNTAGAIGAVVLLALAVLSVRLFRTVRPHGEAAGAERPAPAGDHSQP